MDKKLLIVDDDMGYVSIVKKQLSKVGFSIHVAECKEKMINYLNSNLPDIILVDVLMNNEEGLKILRELVKTQSNSKVIVISRAKNIEIIEKSFKYGAYDYIIKPFNLKDLTNKVLYAINMCNSKNLHHV